MGLIRLGICVALDSVLTLATAGAWVAMSSCEMGSCFTSQELRFQREKEAIKEVAKIMGGEKGNGAK